MLRRKYNPNSARPRIFDGAAEAKLIALSPPPEGFARWSLRLLEEKVVELHIVERASDSPSTVSMRRPGRDVAYTIRYASGMQAFNRTSGKM